MARELLTDTVALFHKAVSLRASRGLWDIYRIHFHTSKKRGLSFQHHLLSQLCLALGSLGFRLHFHPGKELGELGASLWECPVFPDLSSPAAQWGDSKLTPNAGEAFHT